MRTNAPLAGCEQRIRSGCASELTQKDWCSIWRKAKSEAMKGRLGLLTLLLPIVARKMPDELPDAGQDFPIVPESQVQKFRSEDQPSANA